MIPLLLFGVLAGALLVLFGLRTKPGWFQGLLGTEPDDSTSWTSDALGSFNSSIGQCEVIIRPKPVKPASTIEIEVESTDSNFAAPQILRFSAGSNARTVAVGFFNGTQSPSSLNDLQRVGEFSGSNGPLTLKVQAQGDGKFKFTDGSNQSYFAETSADSSYPQRLQLTRNPASSKLDAKPVEVLVLNLRGRRVHLYLWNI